MKPPITHPEGEHGGALGAVDVVPDTEVGPVLGHHHVTAWHPLDVGAERKERGLYGAFYVVQVELEKEGEKKGVSRVAFKKLSRSYMGSWVEEFRAFSNGAVTLKLYRGRKLYRPTSSFVYILTT